MSSAGVFAATLTVQGAGFVGSVALYKFIGVSTEGQALLGTVQLFFLIATSISSVGDLRFGSAYTFFIARGQSPRVSTSTYVVLRFVIAGAAALLLLGIAPLNIGGLTLAGSASLLELLAVFLCLPILWSLPAIYSQLYVALGDSVRAQYPSLVEVGVRVPLILWAALYDPTLWGITLAYTVGVAASAAYSLPSIVTQLGGIRRAEAVRMFRFAWPLMASLIFTYVATSSMPFLINAAAGVRQLNIFNAANGFRLLALSFATSVATPLFPLISGLHHRREFAEVRRRTEQTLRLAMILIVPGSLALAIFSVQLLEVFTTGNYLSGTVALVILSVSVIPASLSTLIFTALISVGRQRLELGIAGIQTAVLFAVAFLLLPPVALMPRDQVLAAGAIAILVSSFVALAMNLYYLSTILGARIPLPSVGWAVSCSVLGLGIVAWGVFDLHASPLVTLLAGGLFGLLATTFLLAGVGELTQEDVRLAVRSMGLPRGWGERLAHLCWRPIPAESRPRSPSSERDLGAMRLPASLSDLDHPPPSEAEGDVQSEGGSDSRRP